MAGEWEDVEVEVVLDEYFAMLRAEVAHEPYIKAEHNRAVQAATGRGKGSVEFKFQNVSAVLQDLELLWVQGYKPRSNYQTALRAAVEQRVASGQLSWIPTANSGTSEPRDTGLPVPSPAVSGLSDYAAALAKVPERAFGGADVAVSPARGQDDFWPEGPAAPGADEVISWLHQRLDEAGPGVMAFLVGGPGNGKSYLSATLVDGMTRLDRAEDGLAHRTYTYATGGPRDLRLVNDATISPATTGEGASRAFLIADIEDAHAAGEHLVANVNRGILFEELSEARSSTGVGLFLTQWLHGANPTAPPGWDFAVGVDEQYLKSALVTDPAGSSVEAVAVFMDECSLLERRPEVVLSEEGPTGEDSEVGRYDVARLDRRYKWAIGDTPGGTVLAKFIQAFPRPSGPEPRAHDPFAANLISLADGRVQQGLVTILRAAEIASAKRFTYRELWGAIARLVIGDSSDDARVGWRGPFGLVERVGIAQAPTLEELLELASYRYHQTLFAGARSSLVRSGSSRPTPVTSLTSVVDPARDAKAGSLGEGSGWADPVLDAFAGHAIGESALAGLFALVPDDDPVRAAVTDFDRELDDAITQALAGPGLPDHRKRELVAWYGQYLTRLYATSHGIPAFYEELRTWTRAWQKADGKSAPPGALEDALRTLLLPSLDPDDPRSSFVLPALEPRTLPVSGRPDDPRLVVLVPTSWSLATRTQGDALFVSLRESGTDRVELELDFAMLREALACREGHVGVTEFTDTASPRLERFRAALLLPGEERLRYGIVDGEKVHELEID